MGSRVNVCSVDVLENPGRFSDPFKLEITFEVFENLPHDLEWELVYVGSGDSREYDQALDSVVIGPIKEGKHKFVFEASTPDVTKIPSNDVVGVTVLLLKCKYNDQEFLNLGWYVSNEYEDEELKENPPSSPIIEKLVRSVKQDDLRVTAFPIKWTEEDNIMPAEDEEAVDETDLMPLEEEDDCVEDNEIDEDEVGDAEVDLEATAADDEVIPAKQEAGDVEMDDESTENGDAALSSEATKDQDAAIEMPLGDLTNGSPSI